MKAIGVGVGIPFGRSRGWIARYTNSDDVLFIGEISKIIDGKLYNQKKDATDFLTVGGVAGSYTFQAPNTAPYISADTDYIWFKTDGTQRTTTEAELIGYDLQKTPVKYLDDAPNSIEVIMILNNSLTGNKLDRMHKDFRLPILWDGTWSDQGYVKSNRPIEQQYIWTPEVDYEAELIAFTTGLVTPLSEGQKTLLNNFIVSVKTALTITSLSDFFDTMYIQAGETLESSLRNLVKNDHHGILRGAEVPAFTALEGFTGNGFNAYIDFDYTPSADKAKYLVGGASAGVYVRTAFPNAALKFAIGSRRMRIGTSSTGSEMSYAIYSNPSGDVAVTPDAGMYIVTKTTGNVQKLIKNGSIVHNGAMSEQATDDYKVYGCAGNTLNAPTSWTGNQISLTFLGGYMTEAQALALTNAIETYMDANNKGIIA